MKYIAHNLEEMQKFAAETILAQTPKSDRATVFGLYGDLGAGKTSFTQGVAKALAIEDTVVSPTFVIEKIYELTAQKFAHLIHIDAYRLEKSEELSHLGWQEIISDRSNLILIEWPERVADIMPEHTKIIFKTLENPDEREIEIV